MAKVPVLSQLSSFLLTYSLTQPRKDIQFTVYTVISSVVEPFHFGPAAEVGFLNFTWG